MLNVTLARALPASPGLLIRLVATAEKGGDLPGKRQLDRLGFSAKAGETLLLASGEKEATLLVGVGDLLTLTPTGLRLAGIAAARGAGSSKSAALVHSSVTAGFDPALAIQLIAEGLVLGAYSFTTYKSEPSTKGLNKVSVVGVGDKTERDGLVAGLAVARAICFARDLVNEPGGTLTPTVAAERVGAYAKEVGLTVTVLGPKEIAKERLAGTLAVNQGSVEPPRFVKLEHRPEGAIGHVALVGKGITFDSGGLSIKPAEAMMTMKCDMAGAAAVAAATCAIAALGTPVGVTAYMPFTDNMSGGAAIRPGDVFTARNGTTVEVLNTDAEGRLVLGDALAWAAEGEPDAIVDVATLTGACLVALGDRIAGVLSNNDELVNEIESAAEGAGERFWRLPLPDIYEPQIASIIADVKNIGSRFGGTLTAGLFLQKFVGDVPWAHLDIAGPAYHDAQSEEAAAGGTGFGVRTLIGLVQGRAMVADAGGNED